MLYPDTGDIPVSCRAMLVKLLKSLLVLPMEENRMKFPSIVDCLETGLNTDKGKQEKDSINSKLKQALFRDRKILMKPA
jgi:hypothetical protein